MSEGGLAVVDDIGAVTGQDLAKNSMFIGTGRDKGVLSLANINELLRYLLERPKMPFFLSSSWQSQRFHLSPGIYRFSEFLKVCCSGMYTLDFKDEQFVSYFCCLMAGCFALPSSI